MELSDSAGTTMEGRSPAGTVCARFSIFVLLSPSDCRFFGGRNYLLYLTVFCEGVSSIGLGTSRLEMQVKGAVLLLLNSLDFQKIIPVVRVKRGDKIERGVGNIDKTS